MTANKPQPEGASVPMSALDYGISVACFYGCPRTEFAHFDERLEVVQDDIDAARQAGVSSDGITALEQRAAEERRIIQDEIALAPKGGPGPWRISREDMLRHQGIVRIQCCRTIGVWALTPGRDCETIEISQPGLAEQG